MTRCPSGGCQITKTDLISLDSYGPPEKLDVVKVSCQVILKKVSDQILKCRHHLFFLISEQLQDNSCCLPCRCTVTSHLFHVSQEGTQGRHDSAPEAFLESAQTSGNPPFNA